MRTRAIAAVATTVMTGIALATVSTAGVASAATPDPRPPVISLISPTPGAKISQSSEILLYATVSDPDGTIAKVEFYDGSTLLATDTTALYWYAIPAGTAALGAHTFTARAYDDQGLSATSSAVTVYVIPPPIITVTGYVRAGAEAGCMILVPDASTPSPLTYLLLGGDRRIIVPGAHLRVTGEPAPDIVTTCMQGIPFKVSSAEPV